MVLQEFYYGILLTIIGIIIAEFIIHYLKERIEINKLITSIEFEIVKNLEIVTMNKKLKTENDREMYLPFEVIASHNFNLSITRKIIKRLGKDAVMSYFIGYIQCERFNREYKTRSATLYSLEDECFKDIENNFNNFLRIRQIRCDTK